MTDFSICLDWREPTIKMHGRQNVIKISLMTLSRIWVSREGRTWLVSDGWSLKD